MGHYVLNYPIETPEAIAFWDSEHKANTAKAYVAFSKDEQNFREITKRAGYTRAWRDRMWEAFGIYVNQPDMTAIPFSEMSDLWWNEMPTPALHTFTFPPLVPAPMPTPDPDPELPVITVAATDQVAIDGGSVTFTTNATDYLAVQWYRGSYPIPGETSTTLSFTPSYHDHCVVYTAVYMNADGYSSTRAQLTVLNGNPDITLQPVGGTGTEGQVFTLTTTGTGQTGIKWFKQDKSTLQWVEIPGETLATLDITGTYTGLFEYYRAEYSNAIGTTITNSVGIYFAKAPVITVTYSHTITFGNVGSQIGYDAVPTEEGDLVPADLSGFVVEQLLTNIAGTQLQLGIGGQNASAITISVPSYGPETFSFVWLSGLWRLRTTENPTAGTFLTWWHSRTSGEVHDIDLILTP